METQLFYLYHPVETGRAEQPISFISLAEFLQDEPACKQLLELVTTQFRTRSKFLAVWAGVRYVAVHRDSAGLANGFLLVNAPVNWQIDYVVVHPDARGQGIAGSLVTETLHQAFLHGVPFVSLASKPGLREFYESFGFKVVSSTSD